MKKIVFSLAFFISGFLISSERFELISPEDQMARVQEQAEFLIKTIQDCKALRVSVADSGSGLYQTIFSDRASINILFIYDSNERTTRFPLFLSEEGSEKVVNSMVSFRETLNSYPDQRLAILAILTGKAKAGQGFFIDKYNLMIREKW